MATTVVSDSSILEQKFEDFQARMSRGLMTPHQKISEIEELLNDFRADAQAAHPELSRQRNLDIQKRLEFYKVNAEKAIKTAG